MWYIIFRCIVFGFVYFSLWTKELYSLHCAFFWTMYYQTTAHYPHAHTQTRKHANTHTRTHAHTHTRTHAHTHTRTHAHTHTRTHAHTHTRTPTICVYMHAWMHERIHTRTHAGTQARKHEYVHTHKHASRSYGLRCNAITRPLSKAVDTCGFPNVHTEKHCLITWTIKAKIKMWWIVTLHYSSGQRTWEDARTSGLWRSRRDPRTVFRSFGAGCSRCRHRCRAWPGHMARPVLRHPSSLVPPAE